jgi:phage gp29-like protein
VGDSGSLALGNVHDGVLSGVKDTLANWAAKAIRNQLIRPLLRLNFGDDVECPFLLPRSAKVEDPKALAERDVALSGIGMKLPSAWMYERHGVPKPDGAEDVIGAPMPMPGATGADGNAAAGGASTVQETALNGAQVTALANLAQQVADGLLPVETARSIAIAAFPAVAEQVINKIFGALRSFTPRPDPAEAHVGPKTEEEIMAKDATDKLAENVIEELTGVEAKWLGGVRPFFARLIAIAQSRTVSDAEFLQALEDSRKHLPELFNAIDHDALAGAMEKAMAAAVVNGAVSGHLKRSALKAKGTAAVRGEVLTAVPTPRRLVIQRNERGHMTGATVE